MKGLGEMNEGRISIKLEKNGWNRTWGECKWRLTDGDKEIVKIRLVGPTREGELK